MHHSLARLKNYVEISYADGTLLLVRGQESATRVHHVRINEGIV